MNGISIKNIGILHNREFDDGVLKIEFYDEEAKKRYEAANENEIISFMNDKAGVWLYDISKIFSFKGRVDRSRR